MESLGGFEYSISLSLLPTPIEVVNRKVLVSLNLTFVFQDALKLQMIHILFLDIVFLAKKVKDRDDPFTFQSQNI